MTIFALKDLQEQKAAIEVTKGHFTDYRALALSIENMNCYELNLRPTYAAVLSSSKLI